MENTYYSTAWIIKCFFFFTKTFDSIFYSFWKHPTIQALRFSWQRQGGKLGLCEVQGEASLLESTQAYSPGTPLCLILAARPCLVCLHTPLPPLAFAFCLLNLFAFCTGYPSGLSAPSFLSGWR